MVRVGLGKGRGLTESAKLLQTAGFEFPVEFMQQRLPYFHSPLHESIVLLFRQGDLPWFLNEGHIDLAVGSGIWFRENELQNVVRLETLGIQQGRLSLIVPQEKAQANGAIKKVFTRFPSLTAKWVEQSGYVVEEIIYMSGSHETALILGIADAIVDIISTGWTIHQLKLKELETLMPIEHEIWIRKTLDEARKQQMQKMFPQFQWQLLLPAE